MPSMSALCGDGLFGDVLQAALGIAVFGATSAVALLVIVLAARVRPSLLGTTIHNDDHDALRQVRSWCDDRLTDPLLRAELLAVLDEQLA
jgi:hypothetical protein